MTAARLVRHPLLVSTIATAAFGVGLIASTPQERQMAVEVRVSGPSMIGTATAIESGFPVDQTGTGVLVGQVVDAGSGTPVAGAVVSIGTSLARLRQAGPVVIGEPVRGRGGGPAPERVPNVLTDSSGRFAFRNLPAGAFTITVQKPGYLDGAYGRLRPNGPSQPLDLADGERRDDVTVRMFRPAAITGRVVDERSEPVVGATVRAYRRELRSGRRILVPGGPMAATDDRGVYRLSGLVPGEYVVSVPTVHQSAPADFSLQGGFPSDLMATMMTPGNTGFSYNSGGAQVAPGSAFVLQSGPGQLQTAPENDGRLLAYPTVYYPSASVVSEAAPIVVASGEERQAVDIALNLLPTAAISGQLIGPDGPAGNYALHLVPSDTGDMSADPDVATAITAADGSFMFLGVPAGNYVIQTVRVPRSLPRPGLANTVIQQAGGGVMVFQSARIGGPGAPAAPPLPTDPTLWTAAPVSVGAVDVQGLTLALQEGYTITGRVEFDGAAPRPTPDELTRISIAVEPADGRQRATTQPGRVDENGAFETPGLVPGPYLLRAANAGRGWSLKSITAGGVDVSERPLDLQEDTAGVVVTFTDRVSNLTGVVRTSNGAPDNAAAVLVFPSDSRTWIDYGTNPRRMRLARTTDTGAYRFAALPPGDYYVVAISEEFANDWQDPEFLQAVAAFATIVSVGEGLDATRDLTTQAVRGLSGRAPAPVLVEHDSWDPSAGHGPFVPESDEPTLQQTRDRMVQPTSGTASVTGVVITEDGTGQPLRRVRVSIRSADSTTERAVMTDDRGRFVLSALPPGRYSLTATKPAYVTSYYGSRRPGRGPGTPLALTAGAAIDDIVLRMARGAVIAGRVIDEFGQPLADARIRVMQRRAGGQTLAAVPMQAGVLQGGGRTDDLGRYRIFGLVPGEYVVMLSPPTNPGPVETRQLSRADVDAAIADVRSGAMNPTPPAGVSGGRGAEPTVPAVPFGGRAVGFAPIFYPGTPRSSEATAVTVRAGQEVLNIDMALRLVPMARIEGTVSGPDGQPAAGVTMLLLPEDQEGPAGLISLTAMPRTAPDGTFTATNVAPGRYRLSARWSGGAGAARVVEFGSGGVFVTRDEPSRPAPQPGQPPARPLWAETILDVNGENLTGIALTMQEGMTVSGQVVFDGMLAVPDDLSSVRVGISPADSSGISLGIPLGAVNADGTFTLDGVTPGAYRLTASAPPTGFSPDTGWRLRSAMLGDQDTLDTPLQVAPGRNVEGLVLTFTDRSTELTGTIVDPAGDPVSDLTILVFPADRSFWSPDSRRMPRPQQPGSDGMFRVTGLPPGNYLLAVVTQIDQELWGDPSFMEQLAAAALPIVLRDGQTTVQDIKVGGGS